MHLLQADEKNPIHTTNNYYQINKCFIIFAISFIKVLLSETIRQFHCFVLWDCQYLVFPPRLL